MRLHESTLITLGLIAAGCGGRDGTAPTALASHRAAPIEVVPSLVDVTLLRSETAYGSSLQQTFSLKNTTDTLQVVRLLGKSCGCVSIQNASGKELTGDETVSLGPAQSSRLTAVYAPPNAAGVHTRRATFGTDLVNPSQMSFAVNVRVLEDASATPPIIIVMENREHGYVGPDRVTVTRYSRDRDVLATESTTLDNCRFLAVSDVDGGPITPMSGGLWRRDWEIRLSPRLETPDIGERSTFLNVAFSSGRSMSVPVSLKSSGPSFIASPSIVRFTGALQGAESETRHVLLSSPTGIAFKVDKIVVGSRLIGALPKTNGLRKAHIVSLKYDDAAGKEKECEVAIHVFGIAEPLRVKVVVDDSQ